MINSKLQGETTLKDKDIARVAKCSTRTVRYLRSNLSSFGLTKSPSNGAGRPKTITPHMLISLHDLLSIDPCMRFCDMVTFLRKEFDVEVTRFSISRALKEAKWSKKVTQNIARERNPDLRDKYVHEISNY